MRHESDFSKPLARTPVNRNSAIPPVARIAIMIFRALSLWVVKIVAAEW
jgi:hypothetical protein